MKIHLVFVFGGALVLAACGGGDSPVRGVPYSVNDPESARTLVGGSPLDVSGSQIETFLDRELRQADTLLGGEHDLRRFFGAIESNCHGTRCNTSLGYLSTGSILETDNTVNDVPVELDADYSPVMAYRGISIAQGSAQVILSDSGKTTLEEIGLGGWLEYSGFWVREARIYERHHGWEYLATIVVQSSFGDSPSSRPAFGVTGSATWGGAMVAADIESRHRIIAASTVRVDLARMNADVQMSGVVDTDTRTRLPSFGWTDLPIQANGKFGDGSSLSASFYGPNHEEVGGIFTTDDLIGAFGANRQ